jgi:hypothetical protein
MNLEYVPLLRIQRELQGMPRSYERFREYLRTMTNEDGTGLELPSLGIVNPMAREHVTELLDALLVLDADRIAAAAVAEAAAALAGEPGECKVALVVADDRKGGWTNRWDYEWKLRFPTRSGDLAAGRLPKWLRHFWLTGVLWSSEPAGERAVRETMLTTIYRAAHLLRHGPARTLRAKLAQEGAVLRRAGCAGPVLEGDDMAYTREVLVPFLEADDMRTTIECLFGDAAARTLGFTPRGLSPWAGIALALHDAQGFAEGTGPA